MPKSASAKKNTQERTVPTLWNIPDELLSGYATNILVQKGEEELYVSFFELRQPVLLTPEDAAKLESVTAECIARIVVTPKRLKAFVEVLQKQLESFESQKTKAQKSNGSK
jgi:hypothetical protein